MVSSMRLVAVALAASAFLAACGDDAPTEPGPTPPPASPSSAAPDDFGTGEVSEPSELFGQLVDVRLGEHPQFDRVVLEFAENVPGYAIKYVELPVSEDGSGEPVDLPGAAHAVQIVMSPASGFDMEAGVPTFTGSRSITNDGTAEVTGVVSSGDFEAMLSWVVGLRREVPFKVTELGDPARLVVDFHKG